MGRAVFFSAWKLVQWLRKWYVFSTSQLQVQSGFKVSRKLFFKSCSWKWLSPNLNIVRCSVLFRLWLLDLLLRQVLESLKYYFRKIKARSIWISAPKLFHSMMIQWWLTEKNYFSRNFNLKMFNLKTRNIIYVTCRVRSGKIRKLILRNCRTDNISIMTVRSN